MIRMMFSGLRLVFCGWSGHVPVGRMLPVITIITLGFLAAGIGETAGQDAPVQDTLKARCDQLVETGSLKIGNADIAAVIAIPRFYRAQNYEPAWTDPENIRGLMRAVDEMYNDGLDPEDYHRADLRHVIEKTECASRPDPGDLADLDILLSDALLRMAYHIEYGKVDPEQIDPNWNINKEFRTEGIVAQMQEMLSSERVFETLEERKSQHQLYICLKRMLAEYRAIEKAGGWDPVPEGKVLKKGVSGDAVVALRKRLTVTGDLPGEASTASADFDEELERAVMHFQERHGLAADGVVGKASLEALNVPVESRIDQLRVNLERGRWVLQDFTDTFLLVNIAGFRVYYAVENRVKWSARAQVGKTYRQTPVFKAEMEYLVFNPTWTVPPTILKNDVLPAIQKDIGYLAEKNMVVLDNSGKVVDPGSIDWARYAGGNFPYTIRQEPGPTNALGRVKFIFPNKHFVFLHDTPSKSLFERSERAFSSGCIRVEHPFELAELLLADKGYDQAKIAQVLDTGKLENVYLTKPLPTLLLYWTTFTTLEGQCNFRKDVYGRDPRIVAALDGPIVVRKEHEDERNRNIRELKTNQ